MPRRRTKKLTTEMTDPLSFAVIAFVFLLAGTVKGVVGLGLPTVSLALLTALFGLQPAMALLLAPSLATNVWQALSGRDGRMLFARLWPLLLTAAIAIWLGVQVLAASRMEPLRGLLGLLLVLYAGLGVFRVRAHLPQRWERWAAPLVGSVNGLLTGMTGSFVVPGVLYLQAIGLARDQLVQAMGMLFTVSTLALAAALGDRQLIGNDVAILSLAAVVPAWGGLLLGQRLRQRTDEVRFRRLLFAALGLLGVYILVTALL